MASDEAPGGASDHNGDPDPGASAPARRSRNRTSIAERSARRERAEEQGRDRYDNLLRQLQAGREVPVRRQRTLGLEMHPIALRLLLAGALAIALYGIATFVMAQIREHRVDTWAGPTSTVTSGQRLESCTAVVAMDDPVFPAWIRYAGGVFVQADAALPMGDTNIGTAYLDSGYVLGALRIYDVAVAGLGEPGTRIIVRTGTAPAGELYERTTCT